MAKKPIDATNDMLAKAKDYPLGERGEGGIDRTTDNDFVKATEMAAFMNEKVRIIVHATEIEGSLDVITPSVNGINQPVVRGVESVVKRKYVEALARARYTKVTQVMNPYEREKIKNVETTVLSYPFSVLEDRNPIGREWLKAILKAA